MLEDRINAFLSVNYGYGSGYGSGRGSDGGYGWGFGDGSGVKDINGNHVYIVDGIQTIIKSVRSNIAQGFVLQSDLTTLYMTLSRRCKKNSMTTVQKKNVSRHSARSSPSTTHLILTETSSPIITYSQAHVVWDARVTARIKA